MNALQSIWSELASTASDAQQAGYLLRLVEAHAGCRSFAALQVPEGLKCIILGVPEDSLPSLDMHPVSPALRCIVTEIEGLGDGQAGVVLTLNDPDYEDLFVILSTEIINAVKEERNSNKAVRAIFRTIERWRRFLQRIAPGTLSDEEVQGLIGELAVLSRLVCSYGDKAAVMAWTGPDGGIHDFVIGDIEFEVKSYQGNPAGGIWVNDLSQLQPSVSCSLYLIVQCITSSNATGLTLPQFIEQLKKLFMDRDSIDLLTMKLAAAGYLDSFADRYLRKYSIEELSAYQVSNDFPAIGPRSVPSAVEKVYYRLRLAPLEPWRKNVLTIIGSGSSPWGNP